ncbi:hypothetical protein VFPPC_16101 [Pochonia chlamydosporia 170]|uniref:Uncharacterized protein n=1 Tax=Pochonia chlamydosporia 170 TaxID=1380566 RepID=A0A179FP10_METCM|nr:hypothetical protein VFPPC_16101 [Pochonia chlamydosporia 170]OAQ67018.1 hypothetical protein VFPPC_16101 [Pochonia chlamydosporia 170]
MKGAFSVQNRTSARKIRHRRQMATCTMSVVGKTTDSSALVNCWAAMMVWWKTKTRTLRWGRGEALKGSSSLLPDIQ